MKEVPETVRFGFISKAHGISGELVLAVDNPDFEGALASADHIYILVHGSRVPYKIEEISFGGSILVSLEDVGTRDKAEALIQKPFFGEQKMLGLEDQSLDVDHLVDWIATDTAGKEIGPITEVIHNSMQSLLSIKHQGKDILVPVHDDVIVDINEEEKRLSLNLPDGLLELYLSES